MIIEAVIGANYGDEGKGLFTEYLCRNKPSPIVVLSNGGCQRGHTVCNSTIDVKHVFHHFGSGTLLGTPTVFSKTFILNPIKYIEERQELSLNCICPTVFRVPGCILQLPGDMFTNQTLEKARGSRKHGSCGWGIWETQVRNNEHFKLTFEDFSAMEHEAKKKCILEAIEWQLCSRLDDFKDKIDYSILKILTSESFCKHFISDFEEMEKSIVLLETDNVLDVNWEKHGIDVKTIVVENGQGLLLDKDYAPKDDDGLTTVHATPSKCGLAGALEAVNGEIGSTAVTANYITRTYFTRHGAGPFPEMTEDMSFADSTNVCNEYQDSIKFGRMTDELAEKLDKRVKTDSSSSCSDVDHNVVVTHCNEVEPCNSLKAIADFMSFDNDSSKVKHIDLTVS